MMVFTPWRASVICGCLIYKRIWTTLVGEQLVLKRKEENDNESKAVAVLKNAVVVICLRNIIFAYSNSSTEEPPFIFWKCLYISCMRVPWIGGGGWRVGWVHNLPGTCMRVILSIGVTVFEYDNNFFSIRPASGNEQASRNESSRVYCACVLSNSRHMFL